MADIWEELGEWGERLGEATCGAIDEVGGQALAWLDEALAARTPEEVGEVLVELETLPFLGAWMREGRERLARPAQEGDVIGVQRLGFAHYGIYASEYEVIHFRAPDGELGGLGDAQVITTTVADFLGDADGYFVLDAMERARSARDYVDGVTPVVSVFPPSVVVARARARLGEGGYDLVGWNCEHFAWWCKTGEAASVQVVDVVAGISRVGGWLGEGRG